MAPLSPAMMVAPSAPSPFPSSQAGVALGELLPTFPAPCPQLPPSDTVTFHVLNV